MDKGKKVTTVKTFRNLHHFDNYYNKLIKSGCTVYEMKDYYNPVKDSDKVAIPDKEFYNTLIGLF